MTHLDQSVDILSGHEQFETDREMVRLAQAGAAGELDQFVSSLTTSEQAYSLSHLD